MDEKKDIVTTLLDFVDAVTELYCQALLQVAASLPATAVTKEPVLVSFRKILDEKVLPGWLTRSFINYSRASLMIPCLLFLSWGHNLIPFALVIGFVLGRFLSDAVDSYWEDVKKTDSQDADSKDKGTLSPTNTDADGFEVVTTGSPHSLPSWVSLHRTRSMGDLMSCLCEKVFVVPVWISMLQLVPNGGGRLHILSYFALLWLMIAETVSGFARFRSFVTSGGVTATRPGDDSGSTTRRVGQMTDAKEAFEFLGTAAFILPFTRYLGTLLLLLAVPLAYESLRRETKRRVIYVTTTSTTLDHKTLRFWKQAKSMGSTLTVGVVIMGSSKANKEMVLNARACSCVDQVIAEAPAKADLMFLERQGIDWVVVETITSSPAKLLVTDEVVNAHRCFTVGEDGVIRAMEPKVDHVE